MKTCVDSLHPAARVGAARDSSPRALVSTTFSRNISGEMAWYLTGAPGVEGMIEYEGRLNDLLRRQRGDRLAAGISPT